MGSRIGIFEFEEDEVGASLDLLPLAARRALDRAGLHLSLEGWRTLPSEVRRAIVIEGARDAVDIAAIGALVARSTIAPRPIEPRADPDPGAVPEDVAGLLGPHAARVADAWPRLAPLARFALAHIARKSASRGQPERLLGALAVLAPADARANAGRVAELEAGADANLERGSGRVREGALSSDEAIAAVSHPGAGGIAVFLGVVRETNEGRAVTLLEYETYRTMAEAELARIEREIESAIAGARVFATHRVGPLRVGDIAVVCAASAPHRGEAFAACRRLIDEIKSRLPIWKREHGPDGPYWIGWEDARCAGDPDHSHAHDSSASRST